MARKKNKAIQIAKTTEGWYDRKTGLTVPFHDLTDDQLQKALISSERQELYFFNRSAFFSALVEKVMEEAERRGTELKHHKSQYVYNTHLKSKQ